MKHSRISCSFLNGTSRNGKVIVYASPNCPKCSALKAWLRNKGFEFEERNLEDSEVMADLILRDVYVLSAPALEVGGKVYTENDLFDGKGVRETLISKILKEGLQKDE